MLALAASPAPTFAQSERDDEFERGVAAFRAEDYESAWFRFWGLARAGDPESQFNLGQLYRLGRGIQRDMVQARRWYERAAEHSYGPAQYQLGVLWERGDGVPADPVEARGWYARAAAQGFEAARTALDRLETSGTGRGRVLEVEPSAEATAPSAARRGPPASPPRPTAR